MTDLDKVDSKRIPLVDIFGPTIQGEGLLLGQPTWFIRLGGCDYKCFFCDTDYAVDPRIMKARGTPHLTTEEIAALFFEQAANSSISLVTLSGGNPAMWPIGDLVYRLQQTGFQVALETQGSIYHNWVANCDFVTISPKGPGMTTANSLEDVSLFLSRLNRERETLQGVSLKIPVLTKDDLLSAERILELARDYSVPLFLQVGNRDICPSWHQPTEKPALRLSLSYLRSELLDNYDRIANWVMTEFPTLAGCPILPQVHVLLWGNAERK